MIYYKSMKNFYILCVLAILIHFAGLIPANAEEDYIIIRPPLQWEFPASCNINENCWITKSDLEGTDITLKSEADMEEGVDVLCAEHGRVVFVQKDDENKTTYGNMIIIEHNGGWKTLYGNLKPDSIEVKPGKFARKNSKIAEIGMSGNTDYPKLHFAVFKDGEFHKPLWKPKYKEKISTKEIVILNKGISTEIPELEKIKKGEYDSTQILNDVEKVHLWIYGMKFKKDDLIKFSLYNPQGDKILTSFRRADKDYEENYFSVVKAKEKNEWQTGSYTAKTEIIRPEAGIAKEYVFSFNVKEPEKPVDEELLIKQKEQEELDKIRFLRRRRLFFYKKLYDLDKLPNTIPDNVKEKLEQPGQIFKPEE